MSLTTWPGPLMGGTWWVGIFFGGGGGYTCRRVCTLHPPPFFEAPNQPSHRHAPPPHLFSLTQMRAQAAVMDYQHLVTFDVRKGQALGRPRNMRADVRRDAC